MSGNLRASFYAGRRCGWWHVGATQSFLDFGNVGVVIQRIGGSDGAQLRQINGAYYNSTRTGFNAWPFAVHWFDLLGMT
jgi:hypothetical protein